MCSGNSRDCSVSSRQDRVGPGGDTEAGRDHGHAEVAG